MAVRVASAAATAAAASPPIGSMVGASAVAAAAVGVLAAAVGRGAVGNNLAVAVVALWTSAGVGAGAFGFGWEVSSSTVGAVASAATCSLVVALPGGGRLVDPVVDSHEVGIFS
jgi:hypothetical protein